MTAVAVDDMHVETIACRRGTVTLTTMPAGWEIIGMPSVDPRRVFRYTVKRCDCLAGDPLAEGELFCPQVHRHGRTACTPGVWTLYHCTKLHNGHEVAVRRLLSAVAKTYGGAVPTIKAKHKAILDRVSPSRRIVLTGGEQAELARCTEST